MNLLTKIRENAKKLNKRIVLPEGLEDRTIQAADEVLKENISRIVLLGDPREINRKANSLGLKFIERATIVNPKDHPKKKDYINLMLELRKHKGLTHDEASRLVENPLYLGTIMIKSGDADGEIAGAMNATGDVLRPAFQFVKTMPGISVVSGAFIMILPDTKFGDEGILIFADCAVHPDPDEKQLAEIAIATSHTARNIAGIEPRIAMLCFSTKG
ncbi:MAG TPA: phosphate acyltransferase, partial [Cyclobacteriaceae bacterium]|nr:phosphate acyltransferase [Cyclobacteriaceae bacterium]